MRRIAHQLADLFARHGLEATTEAAVTGASRTEYRVPLLLATPAGPVWVDGDPEADPDEGAVLRLRQMAADCGARVLLLHAGSLFPSLHVACGDRVLPWSRASAIAFLGETHWAQALGLPLPPLPAPLAAPPASAATAEPALAPAAAEPAPDQAPDPLPGPQPALQSDAAAGEALQSAGVAASSFIDLAAPAEAGAVDLETGVDVVVTTLPTDAADELATAEPLTAPPAPEPAQAPAAAPAEPAAAGETPLFQLPPAFRPEGPRPLPVPEGSRGLLPARTTLDEARRAVSDRLFGVDEWELILQPVHLFDYAVEVLRAGSLHADVQRGRIQVNGTDRRVTRTDPASMDPPPRVLATPDLTVMDKVLRVSPERAQEIAQEWAAATHGKTVQVNLAGADDSFDLLERRLVAPTSGQVKLTYLGVWHRPFWRLWGANGHVDLDAVEGHVLDQELKTVDPDVLVVE